MRGGREGDGQMEGVCWVHEQMGAEQAGEPWIPG